MAVSVSFRTSNFNNSGLSSYTFASTDIGTAAADRIVVVSVGCRHTTARSISSVTIAGVTATELAVLEGSGGSSAGIYAARVPSGTTGSIVVNLSGAPNRLGIGVWAVYGASLTPLDTDTVANTSNPSVTSTVAAGGAVIGCNYTSSFGSDAWTGLTQNFSDTLAGPNGFSGASGIFGSAQSLSVAFGSGATDQRLIVVSFQPPLAISMPAAQGSFTGTGQAATLRRTRAVKAEQGTFTLTGRAAALKMAHRLAAAQGGFVLTGQAVDFLKGVILVADAGTFAGAGQAAGLKVGYRLFASAGLYELNGQDTQLFKGFQFVAEQGTFTLTGQEAIVGRSFSMGAARGAFALSGKAAALRKAKRIGAAMASYAIDGQDAQFFRGKVIIANSGNFTLNGQEAFLDLRKFARPSRLTGAVRRAATLKPSIGKVVRLT